MVLQHVDMGKLMNAMSESNTPSISPTLSINPSSTTNLTNPSNLTSSIITGVIQEIGKQLDEIPKKSSNTSNRFFRDIGKKNTISTSTNPISTNPISTNAISNETSESKGPSSKDLKEISKINWRAHIETGLIGSIFGSTAAYIIYYIIFAISLAFKLFILFIIFNICVIIHKAIQVILDASHKVMGGVKNSLSDINGFLNKVGFDFTIPGVSFHYNPLNIHWNSGDIARINWYPFTDSLGVPISKIQSAVNSIPRDATDVIINMIREMLVGLIDLMPKLFDGMIQTFEKIMK